MRPLWHVYSKETREMMRDKRVRSAAVFSPMFLIIAMLCMFGFLTDAISKPQNLKLHVVNAEHPLSKALAAGKATVIPVDSLEEGKRLIAKGEARLLLVMPQESPNGITTISAYFDKKEEKSKISLSMVRNIFEKSNKLAVEQLLVQNGLPKEYAQPIVFEEREVKVGGDEGVNDFLIALLPYMIVIWTFYGGMGIVSDLVAGEKEKLTLETLLIAPISRFDIAIGKLLALVQVSLLSSLSAIMGVVIMGLIKPPFMRVLFETGLGLTFGSVATSFLVLVPLAILFGGVMLAVSTRAKNMREAQTQLTMVSFVVLIPALMTQLIGYIDVANSLVMNFIPVLNAAAVIRAALQGKTELLPVMITIGINLVLAAIAVAWAIKMFQKESVLTRT